MPGWARNANASLDLAPQSVSLTNVTDPNLGAGNHTFGLACNESAGNLAYGQTYVSVVVLGPG